MLPTPRQISLAMDRQFARYFQPTEPATIISNRNGVASDATKPRNSLSGSDGLGRLAFALEISSASIGAAT